jgi:hypothetical protein
MVSIATSGIVQKNLGLLPIDSPVFLTDFFTKEPAFRPALYRKSDDSRDGVTVFFNCSRWTRSKVNQSHPDDRQKIYDTSKHGRNAIPGRILSDLICTEAIR